MLVFPLINTPNLKLRRIQVEDIPALIKYANNQKISEYVLNVPYPYEEHHAVFRISYIVQGFNKKERYVFAIISLSQNELIGEIGLHLEHDKSMAQLGYWLGEAFWNKGLMTEAVCYITKFGFEKLSLAKIYASCKEENVASQKVLLNNGYNEGKNIGSVIQFSINDVEYSKRNKIIH